MYRPSFLTVHFLFLAKNLPLFATFLIGLLALYGCNGMDRKYTVEEQYSLASSRIDKMKEQLDFSFTLDKEVVHRNELIFFTAHFTNRSDSQLMLRIPEQSGVLDIDHANSRLQYSIIPLDKTISLLTPLSYLGMPFLFSEDVKSSEFVTLDPDSTMDVKLELPKIIYLKQGESWVESDLPPGEYLIHMAYKNLYIGYQVEQQGEIYILDKSAWVGQIDAEPVLLDILP